MRKIFFSVPISFFLAPIDTVTERSDNPTFEEKKHSDKPSQKKKRKNVRTGEKSVKVSASEEAEKFFAEASETKREAKYLKAIELQPDKVGYRCACAALLKLENMNEKSEKTVCKMYKQYKKIRSLGGGKCQATAARFVEEHQSTCD